MPATKSDYQIVQLNNPSDLEAVQQSNDPKLMIGILSDISLDLKQLTIDPQKVAGLIVNWLEVSGTERSFNELASLRITVPLFLLVNLQDTKLVSDALKKNKNICILYSAKQFPLAEIAYWVMRILDNRQQLFVRSEEKLRMGFDELIAAVDERMEIQFCSQEFCKILRKPVEQVMGTNFLERVVFESKRKEAADCLFQFMQNLDPTPVKAQIISYAENEKNTLYLTAFEKGEERYVMVHAQNNLQILMDEFQKDKEHFSNLFEFFHDAIMIIDFFGFILDFNEPFEKLFGYSQKELLSSSISMLFPTTESFEQSQHQLLAKKKLQIITFKKANGDLFMGEVSYSILNHQDGTAWGYFLLFRDISEREHLIEDKTKIEFRLKRSQEIAKLAYWKYDFQSGSFEFSDELYSMLKVKKTMHTVDKNLLLSKYIYPEDQARLREIFYEAKTGKLASGIEFRIWLNENQIGYMYIEASDLVMDENQTVISIEGILQDITDRKISEITNLRKELQIKNIINELDGGYARYKIIANGNGKFDDAVLIETNENFDKLLGIKSDFAIGKMFTEVLPQIDPQVLRTGIQVALDGKSVDIHNDIFDENRWFDLKIYQPEEGQFVISFYDVAEREKASIQIRKQNKYLLALQEITRDLLGFSDLNALLQNILNRACDLVGCEQGFLDFMEPGGTNLYPRYARGDLAGAMSFPVPKGVGLTGTVWLEGKPLLIENYDEWENRLPDLRKNFISAVLGLPLLSNNHVIGVLVIAREYESKVSFSNEEIIILTQFSQLTSLAIENTQLLEKFQKEIQERRFIEGRLRKSEENYRTLFENIPDGVYRTNIQGEFLSVNPAMIKLLGYDSFQDLAKHNAIEFYVDVNERDDFINEFNQQKDVHSAEIHLRRKDGSMVYALENGRAIRDQQGKLQYFEGTITNISERKKAQQLLEKQSTEIARLYRASESLFFDQAKTLEHLSHTIVNAVSLEFGQINCSLFMYYESENALRLLALSDSGDGCRKIDYLPLDGKGIIVRAVRQRQVMNVPDVSLDEDYIVNWENSCSELCIPLIIQDLVLGVLNVESDHCDAFTDDDVRLLSIFAEKASFSLQQSLNNKKEQQRFEKLLQIQKLGTELSVLHDEKSILDTMMRYLHSISPKSNCIVLIFDYIQSGYRIAAHAGFDKAYQPKANEVIPNKDLIYHLRQNNIYYSGDLENVMPSIREVFPDSSNEQFVSFSLIHEGEVLGTILLTGEFASSKEDDAIIEVLAKIVSSALTNARLFKSTNLALERLAALRRIDLAISSSTDITFMIDVLLEQLISQLHVDAADVMMYTVAGYSFNYCSGTGIQSSRFMRTPFRLGEGITGKSVFDRRILVIKNMTTESNLDVRLLEMVNEGFVSYIAIPIIAKGAIKGILEVFHRKVLNPTKDWMDYLEIIGGQAAIAIESIDLFANLQRSNTDLSLAYDSTLEGWASALELRDKETEGHTRRVAELTIELAIAMSVKSDDLLTIRWGALLHDIGKMGIPDEILLKPGALTADEWEIMRKHPVYAYELLSKIDYLRHALDIPYCHHEKWDGSGYPRKLKGEEIPLSARIFSIIDVWDALTSDRPYRNAWSKEKAMDYITEQSGTHFDPRVVEHFQRIMRTENH
jgi:PAS domain S-box-containing protein/putative nucleotidyltransferase with HDIG domain